MLWSRERIDKEDIHIQMLRYALTNPGFTPKQIKNDLYLDTPQTVFLLSQLGRREFFEYIGMSEEYKVLSQDEPYYMKYMLSFEGRSRLLEYDELKEARENAYNAQQYASWALIVSGIGVAISFVGVLVQLFC